MSLACAHLSQAPSPSAPTPGDSVVAPSTQHSAEERDAALQAAKLLLEQSRADEAIGVYEATLAAWPLHPENPELQYTLFLIELQRTRDPRAVLPALRALMDEYGEGSAWAQANQHTPGALDWARARQEAALGQTLVQLQNWAQATELPEDYALLAAYTREWLLRHPEDPDTLHYREQLAEALASAQHFREAAAEYQALAELGDPALRERALLRVVLCWYAVLLHEQGDPAARPTDALVELKVPSSGGVERDIYRLSDAHLALIDATDQYERLRPPNEEAPWRVEGLALGYLPGQILYSFGHYDEATRRLSVLIQRYPLAEESVSAARLVQAMAQADAPPQLVKPSSQAMSEESELTQRAYALSQQHGAEREAAQAFLELLATYPDSENAHIMLYNAANSYERAGEVERANVLYERYITSYPYEERSRALEFRVGMNLAATMRLDQAIATFDRLANTFPEVEFADEALYNAAFLSIGLEDPLGAAQRFEAYADRYPSQPDAEQVLWMAGQQYAEVGDKEALAFTQRYLKRYPTQSPAHVLEAWLMQALCYERLGETRQAEAAWQQLSQTYQKLAASGPLPPEAHKLGARAAFRPLWRQYEQFIQVVYPLSGPKQREYLLVHKQAELEALARACQDLIDQHQDFEHSSAALYLLGAAHEAYAQMLREAPKPPEDPAQLEDLAQQHSEEAIAQLSRCLALAREHKLWSSWQDKTLLLLNTLDPQTYPQGKPEASAPTRPRELPAAGPLTQPPSDH